MRCSDANECALQCDSNATCVNNAGSYTCECDAGFSGDGKTYMDFDDCSRRMLVGPDAKSCDVNAFCTN